MYYCCKEQFIHCTKIREWNSFFDTVILFMWPYKFSKDNYIGMTTTRCKLGTLTVASKLNADEWPTKLYQLLGCSWSCYLIKRNKVRNELDINRKHVKDGLHKLLIVFLGSLLFIHASVRHITRKDFRGVSFVPINVSTWTLKFPTSQTWVSRNLSIACHSEN